MILDTIFSLLFGGKFGNSSTYKHTRCFANELVKVWKIQLGSDLVVPFFVSFLFYACVCLRFRANILSQHVSCGDFSCLPALGKPYHYSFSYFKADSDQLSCHNQHEHHTAGCVAKLNVRCRKTDEWCSENAPQAPKMGGVSGLSNHQNRGTGRANLLHHCSATGAQWQKLVASHRRGTFCSTGLPGIFRAQGAPRPPPPLAHSTHRQLYRKVG